MKQADRFHGTAPEVGWGARGQSDSRYLPAVVGYADPELRQLAMDELAYWAGDKYERLGDLSGAAGQFRIAASHGLGDAAARLDRVSERQHVGVDSSDQDEQERNTKRKFIHSFAALIMGGSTDPAFKARWLPPSDLAPWPVTECDVGWVEDCFDALRTAVVDAGREWRDAVVTAVSWGEHLLGSEGSSDYGGRLEAGVAGLHLLAGCAASGDSSLKSAREHFARAAWLAKLTHDDWTLLNVVFRSGISYMQHEQPNEAIKYLQLGQIAAQDLGTSRAVAVLLAHELWCYGALGNWDVAMTLVGRLKGESQRAGLNLDELARWPQIRELGSQATMFGDWVSKGDRMAPRVGDSAGDLLLCP